MTAGKSVQFHQSDSVLEAYKLRNVPAFSIYNGKQLMIKYEGESIDEGSQLLDQFLDVLQESAGIYTLCVYEEFTGKINDKTPYHGSWNFRFNQNTESYNNGSASLRMIQDEMKQLRIDLAKKQLEDEMEDEEDPDPVESAMDKINGVLSHPLVEKFMPVILNMLNQDPAKLQQGIQQPGQLAGVPKTEISAAVLSAVEKMISADPAAESAIVKLGAVAENNPAKFKQVLGYMMFL